MLACFMISTVTSCSTDMENAAVAQKKKCEESRLKSKKKKCKLETLTEHFKYKMLQLVCQKNFRSGDWT